MIVFGSAITDSDAYEQYAKSGIRLASESDSVVLAYPSAGSLFRNYNLLLDKAAEFDDLEALALIHQDTELVDSDFCDKVREALSDPAVAIVGCAGAIGVRGIAWWEGAVTWASFTHRYEELGGGDIEGLGWSADETPSHAETGEVDSIDGFVMVVSPWAVRELRFDESLGRLHGYDFDFCMQARVAGRKVVTADFRAIHHHSLDLINNRDAWVEAHIRLMEKWDGRLPNARAASDDWRQRALRAEAEAAAAKGDAKSSRLKYEARGRELDRLVRSKSWRLTAPLRSLRHWFGRRG
jgi:Glycosyltransferase like family